MQMVPVSPQNSAQLLMVYPPGNPGMHHRSCHHKHKCKKHRKKEESDSESDSDSDTEYYYVPNPGQSPNGTYNVYASFQHVMYASFQLCCI